jgi:uncharacterized protein (DUF1800 family)
LQVEIVFQLIGAVRHILSRVLFGYKQEDIAEAARALTGWKITDLDAVFVPGRFDDSENTG